MGRLCIYGLWQGLYAPFLRSIFRFSALHPADLAICLGAAIISVVWFEAFKAIKGWPQPELR